jgi:peptide/nickel transport system permease protein
LPVTVLSIAYVGRWLRYMRASMLEVIKQDYIRTARAKGVSETRIVFVHALRNALIPVVTILALSIPTLFGGALITETVFAWPGMGSLIYEAIITSDYYVAIVGFLISATLVMAGNLIADMLYAAIDPRVRLGDG